MTGLTWHCSGCGKDIRISIVTPVHVISGIFKTSLGRGLNIILIMYIPFNHTRKVSRDAIIMIALLTVISALSIMVFVQVF
jgi:hypothetical protein